MPSRRCNTLEDYHSHKYPDVLKTLEPAQLAELGELILGDAITGEQFFGTGAREAAMTIIDMIDQHSLAPLLEILIRKKGSNDPRVREAANTALVMVGPVALAPHVDMLVQLLQHDEDSGVRGAALKVIDKLDASTLVPYVHVLVQMIKHENGEMRDAAARTLGKLDAPALVPHVHTLVQMIQHEDPEIRQLPADIMLRKFDCAALAPHT
eukprot:1725586-Prymnesium_polylepis.1